MERLDLNPEWADDVLIASVVAYIEKTGIRDVALLSQDTGPRLTCLHHGIATFVLDESAALAAEVDDVERENRELQQRVQRLQNAMPRLEAAFVGSEKPSNVARFSLTPHPGIDGKKVAEILAEIRETFPKVRVPDEAPQDPRSMGAAEVARIAAARFNTDTVSPEQIRRYNGELDKFYSRSESYLHELHQLRERASRTIWFEIEIRNTGTASRRTTSMSRSIFPTDSN